MGITRESLYFYNKIHSKKMLNFSSKLNVIELGAQTVHFEDRIFFNKFLRSVGLDQDLSSKFYFNMTGRFMHNLMGHNYDSIDLDPLDEHALKLDLNFDSCPEDKKGLYDLCTNHGTTEHLIGQYNSFKMMHDLTRPGGVMTHAVPAVEPDHGFFSYSPMFFKYLADYNNYNVVGIYITDLTGGDSMKTIHEYNGHTFSPSYVHAVLQKTSDAEFVTPLQIFLNGVKQ